ncbi:PREDICTED: uncharacterized protein LOC105361852 [Ceratosolen solmsi marchali]|uniref:Uncharacterized protein LOC105361852 n=1 Tax=Ceratosolen solmsi marchali TaxID=326594 RepID=A0AAJ6YG46_9HYME|nr:PREDICTED: uncharacterized protein LOC105361852 [Ceratosolen solmsi marchali]
MTMFKRKMPELNELLPLEDLESILRETISSTLTVQVKEWKHLTDPGENFGSLILAVNVDVIDNLKQEIYHLVCKMPPKSDYLLDLFNSPITFKKEIYFYKQIAPAFLQLQINSGFNENELIKLVPHFYGGRMGLHGTEKFDSQASIVLENLQYLGYSTQDRIVGMDLEHMEYGVRELAKLHAIACGYRIKNPKDFEETIVPGLESAHSEVAMKCVLEMIRKAVENLKKMDAAKPYIDKVFKTLDYCEKVENEKKPLNKNWCTFVHSDFWVNNMMFRYSNNGKIVGMKIVDFQLSQYDYGMKDLIFFLISSAKKDVIDENLNDLISLYYETFIETLQSLKVDTKDFPKEEFDALLKACAPLKFPQCIMMMQVIKATRGTAPDVNSIKNKEAFLNIGKGQIYEDKLLHVLLSFVKYGWLAE